MEAFPTSVGVVRVAGRGVSTLSSTSVSSLLAGVGEGGVAATVGSTSGSGSFDDGAAAAAVFLGQRPLPRRDFFLGMALPEIYEGSRKLEVEDIQRMFNTCDVFNKGLN